MKSLSEFPSRVDDLIYFSDADDKHIEQKETFQGFFNKDIGNTNDSYEQSRMYIKSQTGIFGYFADLFNLLINRLFTTQKILFDMDKEYHTAYGGISETAESYPYLDEDSCWSDIEFLEFETGDPDYQGERGINLGTQCFAYKDSPNYVIKK